MRVHFKPHEAINGRVGIRHLVWWCANRGGCEIPRGYEISRHGIHAIKDSELSARRKETDSSEAIVRASPRKGDLVLGKARRAPASEKRLCSRQRPRLQETVREHRQCIVMSASSRHRQSQGRWCVKWSPMFKLHHHQRLAARWQRCRACRYFGDQPRGSGGGSIDGTRYEVEWSLAQVAKVDPQSCIWRPEVCLKTKLERGAWENDSFRLQCLHPPCRARCPAA